MAQSRFPGGRNPVTLAPDAPDLRGRGTDPGQRTMTPPPPLSPPPGAPAPSIEAADPRDPKATALLVESRAQMQALVPNKAGAPLSIASRLGTDVRFLVARDAAGSWAAARWSLRRGMAR